MKSKIIITKYHDIGNVCCYKLFVKLKIYKKTLEFEKKIKRNFVVLFKIEKFVIKNFEKLKFHSPESLDHP